tara:strand:+ start:363 stop:695 length:333 start_codon:yes stop_codon:yes gene_type:complete
MTNVLELQVEVDGYKYPMSDVLKHLKIATESQFLKDFNFPTKLNGAKSNRATWNLMVTRRDVKLWQVGMKPHRGWKITDVKNYFGIKGNKDVIVDKIEALCEMFLPAREE